MSVQTAKPTLQKMVDASQPKLPEVPSEATIKEWARAVAATLVDALPRSLSESDVKTLASNVFKDNKHSLVPVVTSSGAPSEDTIKHWIADAISAQVFALSLSCFRFVLNHYFLCVVMCVRLLRCEIR
jgi:hypothetical protein